MGKFHKILQPGFNLLWPVIDNIQYVQVLKELAIEVPKQSGKLRLAGGFLVSLLKSLRRLDNRFLLKSFH